MDEIAGHRITEGYHRFKAIQTIQTIQDNEIQQKWKNFQIPAIVLPPMDHFAEMRNAFSLFCFFNSYFYAQVPTKLIHCMLKQLNMTDFTSLNSV